MSKPPTEVGITVATDRKLKWRRGEEAPPTLWCSHMSAGGFCPCNPRNLLGSRPASFSTRQVEEDAGGGVRKRNKLVTTEEDEVKEGRRKRSKYLIRQRHSHWLHSSPADVAPTSARTSLISVVVFTVD